MIKILRTLETEGKFHNMIKVIYEKSTDKIILSGEILKAFHPRSGTRQGCPLSLLLFNIVVEIRQDKEMKDIQIGKVEVKLSLLIDDMILCIEKSQRIHKKISRPNE